MRVFVTGASGWIGSAAVDALLTRWRGQGRVDLPGGVGVVRASGRLVVLPPEGRGGLPAGPDDLEEPSA